MNTNLMDKKPINNLCNHKKLLIKNNEQFAKQHFENRAKQGDIKKAMALLDKAL